MGIVSQAASRFRSVPRSEFLNNVSNHLETALRLTPRQANLIMDRAILTLDYFPSIAEIKQIADYLQTESRRYK